MEPILRKAAPLIVMHISAFFVQISSLEAVLGRPSPLTRRSCSSTALPLSLARARGVVGALLFCLALPVGVLLSGSVLLSGCGPVSRVNDRLHFLNDGPTRVLVSEPLSKDAFAEFYDPDFDLSAFEKAHFQGRQLDTLSAQTGLDWNTLSTRDFFIDFKNVFDTTYTSKDVYVIEQVEAKRPRRSFR